MVNICVVGRYIRQKNHKKNEDSLKKTAPENTEAEEKLSKYYSRITFFVRMPFSECTFTM